MILGKNRLLQLPLKKQEISPKVMQMLKLVVLTQQRNLIQVLKTLKRQIRQKKLIQMLKTLKTQVQKKILIQISD